MNRHALILCGGSGTRLSPATTDTPKQFLPLVADDTMIQLTAKRLTPLVGDEISVVTNPSQAALASANLPKATVILEPEARNTAPAIGLASLFMKPSDVMMVFPADHIFKNEEALRERLSYAAEIAASKDVLVTLGIKPTHPHTGLGHIERADALDAERGSYYVSRFVEKPPYELAKQYTESGRYYWNGGMFIWRVEVFHQKLKECAPELYAGLQDIKNTGLNEEKIAELFPRLEKISIDYALLEKSAASTVVLECNDLGWFDIGDWNVYGTVLNNDTNGNSAKGQVEFNSCKNCVSYNDSAATLKITNVNDAAIIKAGERLLLCPRSKTQLVGKTADTFKASTDVLINLGVKATVKDEGSVIIVEGY